MGEVRDILNRLSTIDPEVAKGAQRELAYAERCNKDTSEIITKIQELYDRFVGNE